MTADFGISKWLFTGIFVCLSFAYIIGEIIQQRRSSIISDLLITFGSLWFVGVVHFFLASIIYDIFLGINFITKWFTVIEIHTISYHVTWIVVLGTIATIVLGYINSRNPAIRRYTIKIKKKNPLHNRLTLAVASDIHLGPTNGVGHIRHIVKKINALNPDLILLPGDIMDGEIDPVIRRDLGGYLRKFRSTYGTHAITGNHEYIGGIERACTYLREHSITLLQDEVIEVGGIIIAGQDDLSSARFGRHRSTLADLLANVDKKKPIILLDHHPKKLSEAEKNGVDIQFSGHTHNGQLWPLNLILKRLFELPAGYKKKGHTHIFVSA